MPQYPVADIPDIELHSPWIRGVTATAHLPQPGYARTGGAVIGDVPTIEPSLRGNDRARPDQAHLAAQNIDQLRQFVQAGPTQNMPNGGDAWIVL